MKYAKSPCFQGFFCLSSHFPLYQIERLVRNNNRQLDTIGINRIVEKPLKTKTSDTFNVRGSPYWFLGNLKMYNWQIDKRFTLKRAFFGISREL